MARPALRAVPENESPKPKSRMNVHQAVSAGNRRAVLEAMQSRIARTVDDPSTPPRDLAALSRRLQEIGRDLESLTDEEPDGHGDGGTTKDEAFDASAV